MKKLAALLLCFLMMTPALAEIAWPDGLTAGQTALREYVDTVNGILAEQGGGEINISSSILAISSMLLPSGIVNSTSSLKERAVVSSSAMPL